VDKIVEQRINTNLDLAVNHIWGITDRWDGSLLASMHDKLCQTAELGAKATGYYHSDMDLGEAAVRNRRFMVAYHHYARAARKLKAGEGRLANESEDDRRLNHAYCQLYAGKNAIKASMNVDEDVVGSMQLWEVGIDSLYDAKRTIKDLMDSGMNVSRIRGILHQSLERIDDPQIVRDLKIPKHPHTTGRMRQ
jgi:hypothetical protein